MVDARTLDGCMNSWLDMITLSKRTFGRHIRSLRKARGLTQDRLAEKSGVAVDTIRRLELGSFSPSLDTLTKVGNGMSLRLSTMFESCEIGAREDTRELAELLTSRSRRDLDLAGRVLRSLFDELDARAAEARECEVASAEDDPDVDDCETPHD